MDRVQVVSTSLVGVGYDEQTATLEVEFISGNVFQYGVPAEVHADLMAASSIGGFFNSSIRNAGYQFARMS